MDGSHGEIIVFARFIDRPFVHALWGSGFARRGDPPDKRRSSDARGACRPGPRSGFRILRAISAPDGPADCGHCRSGPSASGTICEALRNGARAFLLRPGGDAESDASTSGTGVHQHLRSSARGGDLRALWRARECGKTPAVEPPTTPADGKSASPPATST